jgi:hypothetical protein
LQNGRGISTGIYFSTDKPIDRVHSSVDRPSVHGPPWTDGGVDRGGGGARRRAHRSSASDCSGAPKLTGARAASRRTGDSGEGSAASVLGERVAQEWREGKRSGERCGEAGVKVELYFITVGRGGRRSLA